MPKARNVQLEIAAANAYLDRYGCGLKIELREGRKKINLRGKLPPRNGEGRWSNQRISLDKGSSSAAIEYAKEEAMRLSVLIDKNQFTWAEVGRASAADTCGEAIAKFKKDWISKQHGTAEAKEKRFRDQLFYRGLSKLPMNASLSAGVLEATLNAGWGKDSAGRKKAAQTLAQLAEFANITEVKLHGGSYSSSSVKREIPSDEEIEEAIALITTGLKSEKSRIARDGWQWVTGMMATYGLRDHEAFFCSVEWMEIEGVRSLVCHVHEEANTISGTTKTGARKVLPLPAHWVELWQLDRVRRPNVSANWGERSAMQFRRMKIPFVPYALRHAWNLRCAMQRGVPDIVRYAMMGHSARTNEIYQQHLREQQMFEGFIRGLDG